MPSLATSLSAMLDRYTNSIIDEIAKDGLTALKNILDGAGFGDSKYLKNYEVSASVRGNYVTFEILLDFEAVVVSDEATKKALEKARAEMEAEEIAAKAIEEEEPEPDATYTMGKNGPMRMVSPISGKRDARTPARNARKRASDIRHGAVDREISKKIANISPRSARVTKDGKLSLTLERAIRATEEGISIPQNKFQGIIGDFMKKLKILITTKFTPALSMIISKNV